MGQEEKLFTTLYLAHKDTVYRNALRFTGIPWFAEEIVQEVFMKMWEKRDQLGKIECISAYLFISCRNLSMTYLRKLGRVRQKNGDLNIECATERDWLEQRLCEKEMHGTIKEAVRRLPRRQQQVYCLRYDGWKKKKMAAVLGISGNTVKNHLERASQSVISYARNKWKEGSKLNGEGRLRA